MRMSSVRLPHVAIESEEVEEVVPLKDAVVLDHPVVLLGYEGLDDGGCNVRVIERTQRIPDVMQERADHIFFVAPGLMGAGRGLQAMFEAVDGEPAEVAAEQFEMCDEAIREPSREVRHLPSNQPPVFLGAFDHRAKLGAIVPDFLHSHSPEVDPQNAGQARCS